MGVKHLWHILQPYGERRPLYELQHKRVAVDLAGWVCEAMSVVSSEAQPRFYLRNLFFRTSYLLLSGCTPVYVLEGAAPPLKYGVICRRLEAGPLGSGGDGGAPGSQHAASGKQAQKSTTGSTTVQNPKRASARGRTSFNRVLAHCEEMLSALGVTCVQGPGEAEAFCAYLNRAGLVDGVISQDSDCFAYGARRVYRNFSVAAQGKAAAQGGAVEVYDMDRIQRSLTDFGQHKMVAMALLCGCDYCPDGVAGVGREAVFKLFALFAEHEVLDRLRDWRRLPDGEFEVKRHRRAVCALCGHAGAARHAADGCAECGTPIRCRPNAVRPDVIAANTKQIKAEQKMRRQALATDPLFPSQTLIDEFLVMPGRLPATLDLRWKQPNVVKFVRLMHASVQWSEAYAMDKILPMLTRWQLFHLGERQSGVDDADRATQVVRVVRGSVQPECIRRKRTPRGIASYEIVWRDATGCFDGLVGGGDNVRGEVNDDGADGDGDELTPWSTIEPVDLVERAYPQLCQQFLAQIEQAKAKEKPASRRAKAASAMATGEDAVAAVPTRKKGPKKATKSVKPVDDGAPEADPLRPITQQANTANKTPVLIDRFLQRIRKSGQARKSAGLPSPLLLSSGPTTTPQNDVRRPRTFLTPCVPTSAQPMNLSQFSFVADGDSMAWIAEADEADGDVSSVIARMMGNGEQHAKSVSFCGRRLRFEPVRSTDIAEHDDDCTETGNERQTKSKPSRNDDPIDEKPSKDVDVPTKSFTSDSKTANISFPSQEVVDESTDGSTSPIASYDNLDDSLDEFDRLVLVGQQRNATTDANADEFCDELRIRHRRLSQHLGASTPHAIKMPKLKQTIGDTNDDSPLKVSHFFPVADDIDVECEADEDAAVVNQGQNDSFAQCISLWHEPDAFQPRDVDVVNALLDAEPTTSPLTGNENQEPDDDFELSIGYVPVSKKLRKRLI